MSARLNHSGSSVPPIEGVEYTSNAGFEIRIAQLMESTPGHISVTTPNRNARAENTQLPTLNSQRLTASSSASFSRAPTPWGYALSSDTPASDDTELQMSFAVITGTKTQPIIAAVLPPPDTGVLAESALPHGSGVTRERTRSSSLQYFFKKDAELEAVKCWEFSVGSWVFSVPSLPAHSAPLNNPAVSRCRDNASTIRRDSAP